MFLGWRKRKGVTTSLLGTGGWSWQGVSAELFLRVLVQVTGGG